MEARGSRHAAPLPVLLDPRQGGPFPRLDRPSPAGLCQGGLHPPQGPRAEGPVKHGTAYVFTLAAAFGSSLAATALALFLARRLQILDRPNTDLKRQDRPI